MRTSWATVLRLLGLDVPGGIDGRVLSEAFSEYAGSNDAEAVTHTLVAPNGHTHLSVTDFGAQRYLNEAWSGRG